jgi:DNA repair exonuclease SbcCD ATPase subunit
VITISKLRMRNWVCFRGEHELVLRPTQYAIVARSTIDPERSNWNGKTTCVNSIDWCLWGRLPENVRRKGDLVTRGEKSCEVELELSDGSRVIRSIPNGPEKLWFFPHVVAGPDTLERADVLIGDEAQAAIERLVGLSKEDFLLAYMRQREMARLVTMDPGPRMELVSGWIRLAPLEGCEAEASDVLAELSRRVEGKRRERGDLEAVVAHELKVVGYAPELQAIADPIEDLESMGVEASLRVQELTEELARLRAEKDAQRERANLVGQAAQFDEVVSEGSELASKLAWAPGDGLKDEENRTRAVHAEVAGRLMLLENRAQVRESVAAGRFDGVCPIAGKACPSADFVAAETLSNDRQRRADQEEVRRVRVEYEATRAEHDAARAALRERERDEQRLAGLRDEARRLKPAKVRYEALREPVFPAGDEHDMSAISNAEMDLGTARARHAALAHCLRTVEAKRAEIAAVDGELARLEQACRTASAACAIFGKGGAQRRIAEGVLGDIERRANEDVLASSGIDLSVRVLWSRETAGLAAACGACGAAYPASRRVRECPRCGAERGPQLTNKLELEPSDRSGAADDLAGFAFQVGASAWLREDRLAGWGVAMLDEPVAQLDGANRKAFGRHLPGVLSRAGFGQALVIAHHASVLDALPARIEVVSDGKHSTVRVVG